VLSQERGHLTGERRESVSANRCGRVCGLDRARHGDDYAFHANGSRESENANARGYDHGRVQHVRDARNMPSQSS
jgi:hypothetical protein